MNLAANSLPRLVPCWCHQTGPVKMFGEQAPTTLLDDFLRDCQHPIYEMEVLPVAIACKIWTKYISGSPTVFYLAAASCIRGEGATQVIRTMLFEFVKHEARFRVLSWFERVPSHSNLADAPSRLCFRDPLLKACRRINGVAPSHLGQWGWARGVLEANQPAEIHTSPSNALWLPPGRSTCFKECCIWDQLIN